jgi:hypothetical protein
MRTNCCLLPRLQVHPVFYPPPHGGVLCTNLVKHKTGCENNLKVEFFENGSVDSLCSSIRTLLDSHEKRQTQTRHNFNSIQHARPEKTCRKYIQAFNRALEKRRSPKRIATPVAEKKLA